MQATLVQKYYLYMVPTQEELGVKTAGNDWHL